MLIHEIRAKNLLSFGPAGIALALRPLNVLIGPNGSGKSNLLDAISLLRAAPNRLAGPMNESGDGILEWIWKGDAAAHASLEVLVDNPQGNQPLRHAIEFAAVSQRLELVDERIENAEPYQGHAGPHFYYRYQHGRPVLWVNDDNKRGLKREDVAVDESILSQRQDPDQYPVISYLIDHYKKIQLFRDWSFGRRATPRLPQKASDRNDLLEADCSNLGLVLNRLRKNAAAKRDLLECLRQLYPGIEEYDVSIEGGSVQVFFHESGFTIPATRLSDGTLRYLSLLAVLCDPLPPPLVCIEEPELGLHPDIMPTIARLLKNASQRMQLVVTTHSDILVDELSDQPEAVVVCERVEGQSTMNRLRDEELSEWLKKYRLGDLWTRGELGGVRW